MSDQIKAPPTRLDVATMNVAILNALGIDPRGVVALNLVLVKDEVPRIEVTYSARYIAELTESMDDGTEIARRWCYELSPLTDRELASPANGADWVTDDTTLAERARVYLPTPPTLVNPTPEGVAQGDHPRPSTMGDTTP